MNTLKILRILAGLLVLTAAVLLANCQGSGGQEGGLLGTAAPAEISSPTATEIPPTPTPDQSAYWAAWDESLHAHTYSLEKGPNTFCARCHAPQNWDPQAVVDPPPNCVSCKFANEAEPRIAVSNPLVPETEWMNIGCDVCHRVENGLVTPGYFWYDKLTGYYETMPTTTMLCEKCHLDDDILQHAVSLDGSAHAGFVCTDCHDAHTTAADCLACHADDVLVTPVQTGETPTSADIGHGHIHSSVSCVACHDSSGMAVDYDEGQGVWITYRQTELFGVASQSPYLSHTLQLQVDCTRCHYSGNPWDLAVVGTETTP
jgi:hypothetical protein